MFDRQQLLKIITGQRNDLAARLVRGAMSALTPVYRSVVAIRNRRFDQDQGQRILKAEIPVISVGNLTTGGTGKTPMVIFVAQFLRSLGKRVVIVSRGYQGSQHANTGRNDEALEMEIRLPDVPHMQDPDRIRMIQVATEELMSEVAVLDDGFQHRQAHRDLDIVLIDATEPFGFGRLLPRGLLREPIESLARADVVVITRCQLADQTSISNIEKRIRAVHSDVLIVKAETVTRRWLQYDGSETAIDGLKVPVFAFCGIGNPAGFAGTLGRLGVDVVGEGVGVHSQGLGQNWSQSISRFTSLCIVNRLADRIGRPAAERPNRIGFGVNAGWREIGLQQACTGSVDSKFAKVCGLATGKLSLSRTRFLFYDTMSYINPLCGRSGIIQL